MKNIYSRNIFVFSISLIALLALMSNSSGRGNVFGQAVTGAPGDSNSTCASSGCHSSGAFTPMPVLSVFDQDGNEISDYTPGESYDVVLTIETTGSPSKFGFQMVSLTEDNDPVNQWGNIGSNMQLVNLGDRDYIEHNSPSTSNEFSTEWIAPESGTGDIKFYFAVNAVNGNGSPSGDGATNDSFTLTETLSSSSDLEETTVNIFPNPTTDFISIKGIKKSFDYAIYDITGKVEFQGDGDENSIINIRNLTKGIYFINLNFEGNTITRKLIKN